MKRLFLIGLTLLGMISPSQSAVYYQGTPVTGGTDQGTVANPTIYDGNPAYVTANTMTLSGLSGAVYNLTLTLNIAGGANNGLYGYLVDPAGKTVVLMNQPGVSVDGFGSTGAGMNITLSDAGATSIQGVTGNNPLSGTYQADGSLSGFKGDSPNGNWVLYFSDTIAGGGNATLNGWSLDFTAVPEPVNGALIVFGAVVAAGVVWRQCRRTYNH